MINEKKSHKGAFLAFGCAAAILILVILLQSGKSDGLSGALSGAAETFFGKNKSRSLEAKLARATAWCAGIFVLLTFVLAIF